MKCFALQGGQVDGDETDLLDTLQQVVNRLLHDREGRAHDDEDALRVLRAVVLEDYGVPARDLAGMSVCFWTTSGTMLTSSASTSRRPGRRRRSPGRPRLVRVGQVHSARIRLKSMLTDSLIRSCDTVLKFKISVRRGR